MLDYFRRGICNDITDVAGVKVGHKTLYHRLSETDTICTGVTAILPHLGNWFEQKVCASSFVLNGFGKTIGLVQVEELGVLESPIMLTNTFSVAAVLQGTLEYMLQNNSTIGDSTSSLNIVVGECNDSHLNSMRLCAVKPENAQDAIIEALNHPENTPIAQGAVGAGKGMICYGVKGGIGSSSRVFLADPQSSTAIEYTLGVLLLSNFGNLHEIKIADWLARCPASTKEMNSTTSGVEQVVKPDGSVIIVVATDAPLNERQVKRLCKRAAMGLARTGTFAHNGSGDIVIGFTTAEASRTSHMPNVKTPIGEQGNQTDRLEPFILVKNQLRDGSRALDRLFEAAVEATEEAVYNSILHAKTTVGRMGRVVEQGNF